MNGLTLNSKFSDVNAGYSTMNAPEVAIAFAASNSGTLNAQLDNTLNNKNEFIPM